MKSKVLVGVLANVALVCAILIGVSAHSAAAAEGEGGTYDYTCHPYFFSNQHRLTSGGDDFGVAPHDTWPERCQGHPSAN